jgi:hypothetical protein
VRFGPTALSRLGCHCYFSSPVSRAIAESCQGRQVLIFPAKDAKLSYVSSRGTSDVSGARTPTHYLFGRSLEVDEQLSSGFYETRVHVNRMDYAVIVCELKLNSPRYGAQTIDFLFHAALFQHPRLFSSTIVASKRLISGR